MPDQPDRAGRTLLTTAALATATMVAFAPALFCGFVSDDFFILWRLRHQGGLAGAVTYFQAGFFDYYRPVAFLSHALDWRVWGLEPFGFHLVNVLLHAGSVVLVFLIARRLVSHGPAIVAALAFAIHPAAHEPVYWIAARFDLLATFLTLASLWSLAGDGQSGRLVGSALFALALLSKESAVSLVVIAPAWDAFVARRPWQHVVRRLVPLMAVLACYAVARNLAAGLDATGSPRHAIKLVLLAFALVLVVILSWRRNRPDAAARPAASRDGRRLVPGALVVASIAGLLLSSFQAVRGFLGFVAYATYFIASPVVLQSPPTAWFSPETAATALPGLATALATGGLLLAVRTKLASSGPALFVLAFIAAALLPVSSMVGGLRYLYLASAGVALLFGWLIDRASRRARNIAVLAFLAYAAVSAGQLSAAGTRWRAASDMTREGVALMSASIVPCGSRPVTLLTAPVGIGAVYGNFYFEAFDVLASCSPSSFTTVLRVVGTDARIEVARPGDDVIELRVPDYVGNIVASRDLRNFDRPVRAGDSLTINTPAGTLETRQDGGSQVFVWRPAPEARAAEAFYYYSEGRVRGPLN